ncbi:V-type ATP synthase subunit I [Patescibacteria group bacterium]|nr:V-type ATP synthase subunit I [Patescibacteria group bacterium]
MAVAEVKKIGIVAHKKDKEKVVDFLYGTGLLEVTNWQGKAVKVEAAESEEDASQLEYKLSKSQFAIGFLEEYKDEEKVKLVDKLISAKLPMSASKVERIAKEFPIDKVVDRCNELEEEINQKQSGIDSSTEEKELLEKWVSLDVKVAEARETKTTKAIFGMVDSEQYLAFIRELEKKVTQVDIRKVTNDEQQNYVLVIFNKNFEREVSKILFKYGLEKVSLPSADKTPRELLEDLSERNRAHRKDIKKLKSEAKKLAKKYLAELKVLFDHITWQVDKTAVQKDFKETNSTFIVTGWMRKDDIKRVKIGLEKITTNFVIEEMELEKGEEAPVIIRNSSFMRPFEAVTSIYGLPKSSEVDPTPFLSIFFIIFFGLCLTDAGYGLVLMVLTYLAIKVLKIPKENQRLLRLLMYGGFVTFIIGALTGGWFGLVLDELPASLGWLSKGLIAIRLINPIENPIVMLGLSFALGYIHIIYGIAIDMWWKIKNGDVKDGILDSGTWIYFLLAMGFYGATAAGVLPESLKSVSLYLLLAGVVVLILTQGRKQKNPIMKLLAGVGSLYGLVGYMSDILSYSRLLALGLATGVIAMVINLIAVMFKDMVPVFGWVLMVLIIIGGHIFNIVINVLGAYIHSGRLQFVEFFPKFFQGGGKIFRPFKRVSKYVDLKS